MSSRNICDAALVMAGALLALAAVPPSNLWPLGLFAWIPLAAISARNDRRRAMLLGWFQGALVQASVLACMPSVLHATGGTSALASYFLTALLVTVEGARYGFIAFVTAWGRKNAWPLPLVFSCAVVCAERFSPMVFPWTTALFVNDAPVLVQTAELGGPWAVSLWVAALDAYVVRAVERRMRFRDGALVPLAILSVVIGFGVLRMRAVERSMATAPQVRIGIVPASGTSNDSDPSAAYLNASDSLLRRENVDAIVWPELAISRVMTKEGLGRALHAIVSTLRMAKGTTLITGAALKHVAPRPGVRIRRMSEAAPVPQDRLTNAAVLAGSDGTIAGIYEKQSLVPFGERIPFESDVPGLRGLVPGAGVFTTGVDDEPFVVGGHTLLPRICLEDMLPEEIRRSVTKVRPELILSLASDTWFRGTRVPELHLAIARLRAVEHRLYFLRVAKDGVTALVSPTGKLVAAIRPGDAASTVVTAAWLASGTPYERVGDVLCWVAAAIALASAFVRITEPSRLAEGLRWRAFARR